ncbi:MAG: SLC13 family permease [Bacteroidaceae bacterium]|nr:SLC13 family permease [Bacteroidaceae bacterium]
MIETVVILLLSVCFFISGKVRSDIVALCALVSLILLGILEPKEALSGFSSNVIIMMIGLFVVGGAIFQTGLAKMISSKLMKLAGNSETRLFVLVMLVTSLMGAFVSNTGTVAIMIPIVVSMAMSVKMNPSRLLMPLAFASSMSGMMTLIGTPPNLVINEELIKNSENLKQLGLAGEYADGLGFFTFLPVGIICVLVGTLLLLPLSKKFLSKPGALSGESASRGKSLKSLVKEYGIANNLCRVQVNADSLVVGKMIGEINIRKNYSLNIIEVRHLERNQRNLLVKNVVQKAADSDTILRVDDVLYISGSMEIVKVFAEKYKLEILPDTDSANSGNLDFYDIGVAEIVVLSSSSVVNKTIREVEFRSKYNVSVLGICRKNKYILQGIADETIHTGDVLLVQGTWDNIAALEKENTEWIVVGRPLEEAAKVTLDYKAPVAAMIMLGMIAVMVFDFIPVEPVTAVMVAGLLMVLTGCFRNVEAAYKTINWESVVLIAAMMPMSTALEKTGASAWISNSLVSVLGGYGPILLMAGIYFTTSFMTMFISNTATAVLMAPIAMSSALQIGVSPVPFLFAVTLGASLCFASPFSTPPNALVMPAGQYKFSDYVKVGLPLQIILGIVMIFLLPLLFPF